MTVYLLTAAATALTLGFVGLLEKWVQTQNSVYLVAATACNLLFEPVLAALFRTGSPSQAYGLIKIIAIVCLALWDWQAGRVQMNGARGLGLALALASIWLLSK
jgi:hypothetical protein